MTIEQALSKLELEEGATSSEINAQYQEFYNEFQMRITNAPTEHQRKLYQKKLEELATAFEVLGGESPENNSQELPGIAQSDVVDNEIQNKQPFSRQQEMSKEKALQFLGLGEQFTSKELENAFKSKVSSCETGRDNAISTSIRNAYEEAIIECNFAHNLLKDYIFIAPPIVKVTRPIPQVVMNSSVSKKKWVLPVSIISGVIIVVILFFAFGNTNTDKNIDPATHDKYVSLKSQADLLAKQGNWQEALSKYEKAFSLIETPDVKDSIASMQNHLLLASVEMEDASVEQKAESNMDNEEAAFKKQKEWQARENAEIEERRLQDEAEAREIEAERLRQEKESKRIKIGSTYQGGIVFKLDASGKHGLVCAPNDQGKLKWQAAKSACENLTLSGYSDWYLPSKDELNLLYTNIGQGSHSNIGGFDSYYYWSSTGDDEYSWAWRQDFDNGLQEGGTKGGSPYAVRAIRAF